MFKDEELKVEQPAIEQLIKLGWTYVPDPALAAICKVRIKLNNSMTIRNV